MEAALEEISDRIDLLERRVAGYDAQEIERAQGLLAEATRARDLDASHLESWKKVRDALRGQKVKTA